MIGTLAGMAGGFLALLAFRLASGSLTPMSGLIYEDGHGEASVSSAVADRTAFWWNERKPDEPVLWDSKIRLGEDFFNEIIQHPVPLDMNTLTALKRCALGLDLYLWLVYRTFAFTSHCGCPGPHLYHQVRCGPFKGRQPRHRSILPPQGSARVEEDQAGVAESELLDGSGCLDLASLDTLHRTLGSTTTSKLGRNARR